MSLSIRQNEGETIIKFMTRLPFEKKERPLSPRLRDDG
jgi:hypothetical protein